MPFWRDRTGQEALPEGREGSESSQERYENWEALRLGQVGSGDPSKESSGVERVGGGRESHLDGWEGLGGPPGGSGFSFGEWGRVGRFFQRARRGQEGQEWLGVPPVGQGVVRTPSRKGREELGRPSRRVGTSQKAFKEGWEA